jgi:hypothetical protein
MLPTYQDHRPPAPDCDGPIDPEEPLVLLTVVLVVVVAVVLVAALLVAGA